MSDQLNQCFLFLARPHLIDSFMLLCCVSLLSPHPTPTRVTSLEAIYQTSHSFLLYVTFFSTYAVVLPSTLDCFWWVKSKFPFEILRCISYQCGPDQDWINVTPCSFLENIRSGTCEKIKTKQNLNNVLPLSLSYLTVYCKLPQPICMCGTLALISACICRSLARSICAFACGVNSIINQTHQIMWQKFDLITTIAALTSDDPEGVYFQIMLMREWMTEIIQSDWNVAELLVDFSEKTS